MKKRMRIGLVVGLALMLVGMSFSISPIIACDPDPEPESDVLPPEVEKSVDPETIYFGQDPKETTVTITVTGAGGTETSVLPMDVVFAIDSSGSMGGNDPGGLRKVAAKSFVDKMNDTRDTGGVVSWDSNVDFTFGLTSNLDGTSPNLKDYIDAVDSSGGTNLNVGLNAAIAMLDANSRTENSAEVIIFLTDGYGTYTPSGSPGSPADNAAGKGYVIYSIGLGSSHASGPLTDMASATGGAYYSSANASNLQAIYDAIYDEIVTSTVPHYIDVIEVTESYIVGHHNFNIAPDSMTTDSAGITTIIWYNVAQYVGDYDNGLNGTETVTLTFDVWSTIYGTGLDVQVDGDAIVEYSDSDDNYIDYVEIPQDTINVIPMVQDLIAGGGNEKSQIIVGTVTVWNDGDYLYVMYETSDGWYMTETHTDVATDPADIPQANGNPKPGQFAYPAEHDPPTQEYTEEIPWTWGPGTTLYIAAHAVVQKVIGYDTECLPIYQEETAWADGEDFPGKNWAMYFEYEDP